MTNACDKYEVASAMEVIYEHTCGEPFTIAGVVRDALADKCGNLFRVLAGMNKRNGAPTAYALTRWLKEHSRELYNGWHTERPYAYPGEIYNMRRCLPLWRIGRAYDPEMYAREESERMAAIDRQCD